MTKHKRLSIQVDDDIAPAIDEMSGASGESAAQFAERMIRTGLGEEHIRQNNEIIGRDPKTGEETLIADKEYVMQYRPIPRS